MDGTAKARQIVAGRSCRFVMGKAVALVKGQGQAAQGGAIGAIRREIYRVYHLKNLSFHGI